MSPLPPAVADLAENLNVNLPPGPRSERIVDERYALCLADGDHPAFTVVQRLRLAGHDVAATLEEVRGLLRARGRAAATWEVGSSATPGDLVERLLALGLRPYDEPLAVGMALTQAPAWEPPAVPVRRIETVDDQVAATRILEHAFAPEGYPPAERSDAERRQRAERDLAERQALGCDVGFVAVLDGRPVATAVANVTPHALVLGAAATLEAYRGRGAYRALVAARFAEAQRRGIPALVVQAGALSRPILRQLGFEEVAEIHILLDDDYSTS